MRCQRRRRCRWLERLRNKTRDKEQGKREKGKVKFLGRLATAIAMSAVLLAAAVPVRAQGLAPDDAGNPAKA